MPELALLRCMRNACFIRRQSSRWFVLDVVSEVADPLHSAHFGLLNMPTTPAMRAVPLSAHESLRWRARAPRLAPGP
jgi:hypothetical protein